MGTPTQKSLTYLRNLGFKCDGAQWLVKQTGKPGFRKNLFNIMDIVALHPVQGTTFGIQVTDIANVSTRVREILECVWTPILLKCNWQIEVHGWKKGQLSSGGPSIVRFHLKDGRVVLL